MVRLAACVLLVCAAALGAAPVPKEDDAARMLRIYGRAEDPDADCHFVPSGEKLRLTIPDKPHVSLDWKPGLGNAPRVLREVEGDFVATARVSFPLRAPAPRAAKPGAPPAASAGLVAWGGNEVVLVVRVEEARGDGTVERFERTRRWADPRGAVSGDGVVRALARDKDVGSALVRLARAGQKVTGAFSRDGKEWATTAAVEVGWAAKVRVGVLAENTFAAPFEATFDEYTLAPAKK